MQFILEPWPWYVAGPLIGLMVPAFVVLGEKRFGISSSFRHMCALSPVKPKFFRYSVSEHAWSLVFVLGLVLGGFIANEFLTSVDTVSISEATREQLSQYGFTDFSGMAPKQLFGGLTTASTTQWLVLGISGFLIGLGTSYAGGCTSGHTITGISMLRLASVTATVGFFIGGLFATHVLFNLIF